MSADDFQNKAAVDAMAAQLKRRGQLDAMIQAMLQICGQNAQDWAEVLSIMTANLLVGNFTTGLDWHPEKYIENLRRAVQECQAAKAKASPIVVTSQMPPAPKIKNGRN